MLMPPLSEDTLVRILFILIVSIVATIIAFVRIIGLSKAHSNIPLLPLLLGRPRGKIDPELARRAALFRWLFVILILWSAVTAVAFTVSAPG
jgi:hypothetical protein